MSIDEVKEYLKSAYYLDQRICTLQDELNALESRLEKCTQSYTDVRGSAHPTFEYTLDKVIQYRERLNCEICELLNRKIGIKNSISKLDKKSYLVMTKRYINFQTFESIAKDLDYSAMQVYRIHKSALKKLQDVIEC